MKKPDKKNKKNAPSENILDQCKTSNHIQSWWCIILCQANRRKTETTQKWPEFLAVFLTPGKELIENVRSTSSFEFCANMKYVEYSGKTENAGTIALPSPSQGPLKKWTEYFLKFYFWIYEVGGSKYTPELDGVGWYRLGP